MKNTKASKKAAVSGGDLLTVLQERFEANPKRHPGVEWKAVLAKLKANPAKLKVLQEMEDTGGEPDIIDSDSKKGLLFVDCSEESPAGRRSLCFDHKGWLERKEHRPAGNAIDTAAEMGIELLTEELYRQLQTKGQFDLKTSSWIQTPASIRKLGGALFCDRRYDQVFTYHNGAQSYYAARGFRGFIWI
jgi:hypothetical protein